MEGTPHITPRVVLQDGQRRRWLCFGEPIRVLRAESTGQVLAALHEAEQAVETEGLWAAGLIAYEAAPGFDAALRVRERPEVPLLWLGLFYAPEVWSKLPDAAPAHTLGPWEPAIDRATYRLAVAEIKEQIAAGYTYQINYTFPLVADFKGESWPLFVRLAEAQRGYYAAYVDTGRYVVCSASPELFFQRTDGVLTSRPMKGTAPRGRTVAEDEAQRAWLFASEKNRAENVMIVDMVRNDMGRVAEVGSVHVPELFEVERYPTVLQMTSTVTSRTNASVAEVFKVLFPCASITGAPKVSAMGIIADLEPKARGVYTGAIGYLAPGGRAQFNVAIRTVVVDRQTGRATYGVGSGVVWDSDADEEYDECLLKARVLAAERPDFELLETMLWRPEKGIFLSEQHLKRLADSAQYFGITMDRARIEREVMAAVARLPKQPYRLRLLIDQDGLARLETQPMPDALEPQPVRLSLARHPIDWRDIFLYHKTTRRGVYEAARRSRPDCDDVVLWNERGEITETCLANVAVRLSTGGELLTPPVDCGLLAGTLRGWLLEQGQMQEQTITIDQLAGCREIYVLSSVRGMREAVLVGGLQ